MITSTTANERPPAQVRFGCQDDDTIRSAWSTSDRSYPPPSPAERKPTLDKERLEKDALAVEILDRKGACCPSAIKKRVKTVPILKVDLGCNGSNRHPKPSSPDSSTKDESDSFEIDPELLTSSLTIGRNDCRSAWTTKEGRTSKSSVFGPTPAQRQNTLDEPNLIEAATIASAEFLERSQDAETKKGEGSDADPGDSRS